MTVAIIRRFRCDMPGCDTTLDTDKDCREEGWTVLTGSKHRDDSGWHIAFHLCPVDGATDTTVEDMDRILTIKKNDELARIRATR